MFSSNTFVVLGFWSILSPFLYVVWGRGSISFSCRWRVLSTNCFITPKAVLSPTELSSVPFSYSAMSDSLWLHGLQRSILLTVSWPQVCEYTGFPVARVVRIHLPTQETEETQLRSLGGEDPLEKEMATQPGILAWRIPWTEEPGGLQSMGSHRVRHDWSGLARSTHVWVCFWILSSIHLTCVSVLMPRPSSLDCSFVVSFEIRKCESSNFVPLFHDSFDCSCSLAFPYALLWSVSISAKKEREDTGSFDMVLLNLQVSLQSVAILKIHGYEVSFHIFR